MLTSESLLVAVVLLISISFSTVSHAYLDPVQNTPVVVNGEISNFDIKKDGSYTYHYDSTATLLQEPARQAFGVFQTQYQPQTEKVKLDKLTVTNGTTVTNVSSDYVEDKPIASDGYGFQSANQITVNFPAVQVGSSRHVVLDETSTPMTSGYSMFSTSVAFGLGQYYEKGAKATFVSDSKIYTWVNDPEHLLKIDQGVLPNNRYYLNIELTAPVYKAFADEADITTNGAIVPWVDVSTSDSWAQAMEPYASKYDQIINSPLPTKFEADYESIKGLATDEAKMSAVLAAVQKDVVYFGDWRAIDGGYIPHKLADIANNGKGDCKDMATSSVAILRKLGFDAHVALIFRGANPIITPFPSSVVDSFNHAIVYLKTSAGADYWLDPTNQQSFLGIDEDIMDRKSVVLAQGGKSFVAQTPVPNSVNNSASIRMAFTPTTGKDASVAATIGLQGYLSVPFTTANLGTSKNATDTYILSRIVDPSHASNVKFVDYQLPARIAQNQKFAVTFDYKDLFSSTSEGQALSLSPPALYNDVIGVSDQRASDIYLGVPRVLVVGRVLVGQTIQGTVRPDCSIDTPWYAESLTERQSALGVEEWITENYKTDHIPASQFASADFLALQNKLINCFDSYSVIFKPTAPQTPPAAQNFTYTLQGGAGSRGTN